MANAKITVRIMPKDPEINLKHIEEESKKIIINFAGMGETKTEEEAHINPMLAMKVNPDSKLKKYFDGTVEVQIRDKEYGNWRFYQEFPTMAKAIKEINNVRR